ncbi:gluconate 2-dehydrogenase subunit 3 family protein [Brevibacillus sp. SYP-B805]|uniref:gluconate 2-dehydrogenase subunit 3 family protein n=1 Tax=Brevibacillus sp. SYP-B805 TaxID=1578199 RepID=UPI0013EDAE95|nr:gluconate 2-dehydrogenase subunit 3 family protein [Brevibacillus sp. SYP-B805]NGQ96022.1 gluconate 2-dehydrogenase subunit 3 family protein [Brevibacillus sp. SYP-B805]
MAESSHYPSYDVWAEHREWDEHTRKIVAKRRSPDVAHRFLTPKEAVTLQTAASLLVDDIRLDVLTYITQHVDETLASPVGEDQRKVGVPEKQTLYRQGLRGLDETSEAEHRALFAALPKEQQLDVLTRIETGQVKPSGAWAQVPAKEFFKKMLHDVVSAYYSHPLIWSEIGYGGPAYPRGYIRVEKGLVDPWEAKQDGK